VASSEQSELLWTFLAGSSVSANLRVQGTEEELTHQAALDWLLSHEDCRIIVTFGSKKAGLGQPSPVDVLLRTATQAEPIPAVPLRPLSARPPSLRPPPPVHDSEAGVTRNATADLSRQRVKSFGMSSGLGAAVSQLQERWSRLPRPKRLTLGATGLASSFLLVAVGFVFGGPPPVRRSTALETEVPRTASPGSAEPSVPAPPASSEPVLAQSNQDSCPELLGGHVPLQKEAVDLVAQGRKQLMAGNLMEARRLFCASAMADKSGPGPESLATLYLAEHSVVHAETWARVALSHHPDRHPTAELLGDVLSAKGESASALETWLKSLGLDASNTSKRALVSKTWTRDAQLAERSGDKPRAERYYQRACALDEQNAAACLGAARVLVAERRWDLARPWIERAQRTSPDSAEVQALAEQVKRHP
jgi:Tfp pilus assembly protein PilF